jgi:hypothetical protein
MLEELDDSYLRGVQDEMIRRWPVGFLQVDGGRPAEDIADVIYDYVAT